MRALITLAVLCLVGLALAEDLPYSESNVSPPCRPGETGCGLTYNPQWTKDMEKIVQKTAGVKQSLGSRTMTPEDLQRERYYMMAQKPKPNQVKMCNAWPVMTCPKWIKIWNQWVPLLQLFNWRQCFHVVRNCESPNHKCYNNKWFKGVCRTEYTYHQVITFSHFGRCRGSTFLHPKLCLRWVRLPTCCGCHYIGPKVKPIPACTPSTEFCRDPQDRTKYYQCVHNRRLKRPCAPGSCVPLAFAPSNANPCTEHC